MATTPLVPRPAVDWTVTSTTPQGMLTERVVTASYFKEDGRLTILRTADHQTVYAVVTDLLVSIERKPAA
jgi:hypothetical protein